MIAHNGTWFALASPGTSLLRCAACRQEIEIPPGADHHPGICPRCGVESAFLNWNGRTLQIVPRNAPAVVESLLRWMQKNLDELEYVELLVALDESAGAMSSVSISS